MIIYHVRPKDLHAPGEHCNTYDCTGVVMKHDYDALAARLAEAESLLTAVPHTSERESILDLHAAILAFLRARPADSGPAGKECWCGLEWEPNCPAHRTEAESFGRYRDAGRDQSWPGAAVSADEDPNGDPWYPNDQP